MQGAFKLDHLQPLNGRFGTTWCVTLYIDTLTSNEWPGSVSWKSRGRPCCWWEGPGGERAAALSADNTFLEPVLNLNISRLIGKICYVRKNATPISRASTSPSTAEPSATSPSVAMGSSLHLRNQVWSKSFYRVTHHVDSNLPLTSKLKLRFSTWASY